MDRVGAQCYSPVMLTNASRLVPVAIVVAVAFGVRAAAACWLPLGADEAQSVVEFWWPSLWLEQEGLMNPPIWRLVVMALLRATDDLVFLRLSSVVCAAAGCGLFTWALLGSRAGSLRPLFATLAGLGLAATPWAVRSQAQVRAYGLTLVLSVAIVLALRALCRRPDRRAHLLAALAVGVGGWVHYALLPWTGAWLLLVVAVCRRAGAQQATGSDGRRLRLRALLHEAGPGLLLGALLLVLPIRMAAAGLLVKAGSASASMPSLAAGMDVLWRPEALLALATIAVAWRARRRFVAEAFVSSAALAIGLLILVASGWTRTVRWTHLVVAAPGLWLGAAVLLQTLPVRSIRPVVAVVVAGLTLSSLAFTGTTASHHRRSDDVELASWRARSKPAHMVALTWSEAEPAEAVGRGLLHASGGFADTPERCLGADRVHLRRCRKRVRHLSRTDCRAMCDHMGCIWRLRGLPEPLTGLEQGPTTPCGPGVLAARLPLAVAVFIPEREQRERATRAALVAGLHLSPGAADRWKLVRVGRWQVLIPRRSMTAR